MRCGLCTKVDQNILPLNTLFTAKDFGLAIEVLTWEPQRLPEVLLIGISRQQWLIEFRYLGNYACHTSTFSISTCSCGYTQNAEDFDQLQDSSTVHLKKLPWGTPRPPPAFACCFALGNEEALTCGNLTGIHWAGWMHSASCHQRPPLSPRLHCPHCHPESDTHKRKAFNWVYSWVLSSPTAHDWILK